MKAQQYYRSKKDWVDNQGNIWKDRKYFYLLNPYERKERGAIIIGFPCLIQPKINGVRCTISLDENNNVQILSKEGKRYNLPHIEEVFVQYKSIFTVYKEDEQEEIFFDGELYIHGEKLQVISSAVKAPNLDTSRVKFVCFDLGTTLFSNLKRIQLMKQLITQLTSHIIDASVEYLATYRVGSDAIVQSMTDKFIEQGYEGSILREEFGVYAFGKRPMSMVKLKRVMDTEFLIVDIIPQEKDNNLGLYVCRTSEGKEFNVTPTGNNEFKSLILFQKHLYIGKMLTCKFYEYTEAGIPFHVLDNIVRDYE
jgi:DNA ligase-1